MAIDLARCQSHIKLALGRDLTPLIDAAEVANLAGEWLCSAQDWMFLERPPVTLDFVAAQTYVSLPADFGDVLSIRYNSIVGTFRLTSFGEILRRRAIGISFNPLLSWGAIVTQAGTASGPPTPRLELELAPGSNLTAALVMIYRAGWTRVVASDQEHIYLPTFMEPVYLDALAEYALGLQERDVMSLSERLNRVMQGAVMTVAWRSDQSQQNDLGQIQNGSAEYDGGYTDLSPWRLATP